MLNIAGAPAGKLLLAPKLGTAGAGVPNGWALPNKLLLELFSEPKLKVAALGGSLAPNENTPCVGAFEPKVNTSDEGCVVGANGFEPKAILLVFAPKGGGFCAPVPLPKLDENVFVCPKPTVDAVVSATSFPVAKGTGFGLNAVFPKEN